MNIFDDEYVQNEHVVDQLTLHLTKERFEEEFSWRKMLYNLQSLMLTGTSWAMLWL